eukprot:5211_1
MYVEENVEGHQIVPEIVDVVKVSSEPKEKETIGDVYYDAYLKKVYDEKKIVPREEATTKGVEVNHNENTVQKEEVECNRERGHSDNNMMHLDFTVEGVGLHSENVVRDKQNGGACIVKGVGEPTGS